MTRTDKLRGLLKENEGVILSSYPNIFYYSGFTSEDALIFVTHDRQILVTDSRYTVQARHQAKDFEIRNITEGVVKIAEMLEVEALGFEEEFVTVKQFSQFRKFGKKLVPMQSTVSGPRRVKDKYEIKKIAQAEELGDAAYSYVIENMRAGMTEREVALMLEFYMRKNGASGTSFETIVASGVRSSMPHGTATDRVIGIGDFVTMDFGCRLDGYCSDMTRTVVVGKCSSRQQEIYDVVLAAQKAAIDKISPGEKCSDIDKAARDIITEAGYGDKFGHSLGHSVGIEIHERPVFAPKTDEVVEAGNVITVEPGIYIDGFGGVRIEDVIVVGETVHNITKSCKDLTII
ncbi:MAG: aminopeptidase P family protein [Clostridia bacterium]|nr:aminopeptidase P family protein [Clostridia bacterium]